MSAMRSRCCPVGQIAAHLVTGGLTAGQLLAVAFGQDGAV